MKHYTKLNHIVFTKGFLTLNEFWQEVGQAIELFTNQGHTVIVENEVSRDEPIVVLYHFDREFENVYELEWEEVEQLECGKQSIDDGVEAPQKKIGCMVACEHCGKLVEGDDAVYFEGRPYCNTKCAIDHETQDAICEHCGEVVLQKDLRLNDDGEWACPTCMNG